MRLYHVSDQADLILERGFEDAPAFLHDGRIHRGVWLFDRPTSAGESPPADELTVVVELPDDLALRHEWLEEGQAGRRFLVPAAILNRYLSRE
jgi:hypothetical protein